MASLRHICIVSFPHQSWYGMPYYAWYVETDPASKLPAMHGHMATVQNLAPEYSQTPNNAGICNVLTWHAILDTSIYPRLFAFKPHSHVWLCSGKAYWSPVTRWYHAFVVFLLHFVAV